MKREKKVFRPNISKKIFGKSNCRDEWYFAYPFIVNGIYCNNNNKFLFEISEEKLKTISNLWRVDGTLSLTFQIHFDTILLESVERKFTGYVRKGGIRLNQAFARSCVSCLEKVRFSIEGILVLFLYDSWYWKCKIWKCNSKKLK